MHSKINTEENKTKKRWREEGILLSSHKLKILRSTNPKNQQITPITKPLIPTKMKSKMNIIIIAALFLVFTSMMQMNGVEAANNNNSKLRGADNN
jgi:hypothetical protein